MNNQPAFPTGSYEYDDNDNVITYQEQGMTLRDYFAAKVMQGLIANVGAGDFGGFASWAYSAADAMLEARSKT